MRAQEAKRWSNISATSLPNASGGDPAVPAVSAIPGSFYVQGGTYSFDTVATTYGTVQLNKVGPDNATLIPVQAATTTNSTTFVTLSPGAYVLTVTGATGLYAALTRCPTGD